MAKDNRDVGRRKILGLMTATPAALAAAHLLNGCGGNGTNMRVDDAGNDADGDVGDASLIDAEGGTGPDATLDASVDAMGMTPDADSSCRAFTDDALGPFYSSGAPIRDELAGSREPGTPLRIEGRLLDAADCRTPLSGWGLDLWQADADGNYHDGPETDYRLRGRVVTDADGRFSFETIKPGRYALGGSFRPAHIHFRLFPPSGEVLSTSQLYFEGDPYLAPEDPCAPPGCRSDDPARIIRLVPAMVGGRMGEMGMLPLFVTRS